jgi:SSS family solute:Na+ symporter/sodium/pantothenate symporter
VARRARRDLSPADHFLAARHLGVFVLFLTLYATAYSGNSLLGYPGEAYRRGFSWVMATGFMMSIVVAFHALVPRLRPIATRHRFVTPGDWIRHRFGEGAGGRRLRVAVGLLMALALGNFLLAQLIAMGLVAAEFTGGALPYWVGVIGLAALILFYETLGGLRAVAWTDAAQGVLMLAGLGALLAWLLGEVGGLEAATRQVAAARPEAVAVPDAREKANWASSIVLLGLASVVYPQAIQRVYAARDAAALKRSLALMTFMPLATTLVVTLIGLAAIPRLGHLGALEADRVMPRLLAEWAAVDPTAALLATLVFLGALAAIMSTADSVLLSLGAVLAQDVFGRASDAAATTRFGKRLAAAGMGVAVVVALAPELRDTLWGLIELKMELLIQCVPAFLLALHWRRLRARPVLAGLLAGTLLAVALRSTGQSRIEGIHVGVLGLALNVAVTVVWTLRTPESAGSPGGRRVAA